MTKQQTRVFSRLKKNPGRTFDGQPQRVRAFFQVTIK